MESGVCPNTNVLFVGFENTFCDISAIIEIFWRILFSLRHFPSTFQLWQKLSLQLAQFAKLTITKTDSAKKILNK